MWRSARKKEAPSGNASTSFNVATMNPPNLRMLQRYHSLSPCNPANRELLEVLRSDTFQATSRAQILEPGKSPNFAKHCR
jgi:hypothetical protein